MKRRTRHSTRRRRVTTASSNRRVLAAAAVAAILLLASGVGYRVLAGYLSRPTEYRPMAPGTLARLPLVIGDWSGRDVPLSDAIIRTTKTDDHLNRVYARPAGTSSVSLFVGYGVRARDLMPHRPEVCYPDQGWTMKENSTTDLALEDGSRIDCRLYRFSRGALDRRGVVVLNYYLVDGVYSPDVSLLRSRAWHGSGSMRYMAQVQIVAADSALGGSSAGEEAVRRFAALAAPRIRALFPDVESAAHASPAGAAPGPTATVAGEDVTHE